MTLRRRELAAGAPPPIPSHRAQPDAREQEADLGSKLDEREPATSDEELFHAHVHGDMEAFRLLFARYAPRIFAVMVREGLERGDAHDQVQQTFLLLHQARRDFEPGRRVRPWLWTIAFNVMRAERRSRRRAQTRMERLAREQLGRTASAAAPEESWSMQSAIGQLSAQQREVVMLHWYAGLSFSEIATFIRISESAVKVRAHRAYRKLREALSETGPSPEADA